MSICPARLANRRRCDLWTVLWSGIAGVAYLHAVAAAAGQDATTTLAVDVSFEGGSGLVESIDQDRRVIRLVPTPHKDRGWQCWWYFRVQGIRPGEVITVDVGPAPWATPDRAAFSTDTRQWRHTARGQRSGKRIVYRQPIDADEAWFAWGPPFGPSDARRLVKQVAASHPFAKAFELCKTRGGRPVPALTVDDLAAASGPRYGVWIQARQHAWESGSSWVCLGLVRWLVSNDPGARALRARAAVTIVPIMDIDNTAIGAGGKQQKPQDHNRDWSDEPHWPSVVAATAQIRKLDAADRFDLFVDLHNPGANDKQPYFYVPPRELLPPQRFRNLQRFLAAAKDEIKGPLALDSRARESGRGYDKNWSKISKNWVAANTRNHVIAVTLETSWNTPSSHTEGYQTVGRQLGRAIERYFRNSRRETKNGGAPDNSHHSE